MASRLEERFNTTMKSIGRYFLRRLEMPIPSYEQRIINNMANLYNVIRPGDVLLVEGRSRLSRIIQLMTKSAWSHAAIYVENCSENINDPTIRRILNGIDGTDRQHMLIEADAAVGVTAVPLSKYKYNIIGLGDFDYKSIWAKTRKKAD